MFNLLFEYSSRNLFFVCFDLGKPQNMYVKPQNQPTTPQTRFRRITVFLGDRWNITGSVKNNSAYEQ